MAVDRYELASALGLALIELTSVRRQMEAAQDARSRALAAIAHAGLSPAEQEATIASAEGYADRVSKIGAAAEK